MPAGAVGRPKVRRAEPAKRGQKDALADDAALHEEQGGSKDDEVSEGRGHSPPRPEVEPVLPSELAEQLKSYQVDKHLPPNDPDVVAIRTSLAVMQIQRQRLRDEMKQFDQTMGESQQQPHALLEEIRNGTFIPRGENGRALLRELQRLDPNFKAPRNRRQKDTEFDFSATDSQDAGTASDDASETSNDGADAQSQFGRWPETFKSAQAPHIEWTKYRVAGEPLNRMHHDYQAGEIDHGAPWTGDSLAKAVPRDLYNPRDYQTSGNPDTFQAEVPVASLLATTAGITESQTSAPAEANIKRPDDAAGDESQAMQVDVSGTPTTSGAHTPRTSKARAKRAGTRK